MSDLSSQRHPDALEPLSLTLARLFEGPREQRLTLAAFLDGMSGRAYPFAVAAINLPNCIPTGIPWLSTITGIPIVLLLVQQAMNIPTPSLPNVLARQALPRGKLQDFFRRARRWLEWLEVRVRPRQDWLLRDVGGVALAITLFANAVLLALPIPFNNLLPAWAIMFFALAQLERDGVMAILGWIMTGATVLWSILLFFVYGQAGIIGWGILRRAWTMIAG